MMYTTTPVATNVTHIPKRRGYEYDIYNKARGSERWNDALPVATGTPMLTRFGKRGARVAPCEAWDQGHCHHA